ncbi:N-acetyltransferase B complex non catalytic subunit-domain-containing protein [Paraphoma chrysanthemicola]|uniref:N-acetyltransferase B complex non catalytic subunit-domain-containing protein n=1 Tax=Paraphoma chrysanthemicola TaxID=798071 RepID=A0A8K0VV64_9PLEO|nr:N-acetyltransferase B complex non catalytic subunit-domain-containing protein [Paraphoma chrysanthemicola]
MSFNNWDKLSKAQRDYPKPKFAVAVVEKALKKTPDNPYLLAWKADLALQNHQDPDKINSLMVHAHKSVVSDVRLLAYMYRLDLDTARQLSNSSLSVASAGAGALSHWLAAAKTIQRKNDRMTLWDTLFYTAMQEDCWEDVRFALVNYIKEGPADKRRAHYSLTLVTQLAAEQRLAHEGQEDRMARLQADIAMKLMKQAYTAPEGDPIAVKDIRDVRFMAEFFKRQDRGNELEKLWNDPPNETLKEIIEHRHKEDLNSVLTKVFRERQTWPLLEQHCQKLITTTMSDMKSATGAQSPLWELCAWRWDVWDGLLKAVANNNPEKEAQQIILKRLEECFGANPESKDRPIELTFMRLCQAVGSPLLGHCKAYFEHHARLGSCFDDLREFVDRFNLNESSDFLNHLNDYLEQQHKPESEASAAQWDAYRQAQLNVFKFRYLLAISRAKDTSRTSIEALFRDSVKLSWVWPDCSDLGFLTVYALTQLHDRFFCTNGSGDSLDSTESSRLLLQAAMYVRHLVEKDKDKQNRTLWLLAARLHLNLGLGSIAFRLYTHTKCKEMLLDTLSPIMLSRISQTHPFDVKSYGGFSADEELARSISNLERMEIKTNGHLLTDIPSFAWDQAIDTLSLKRKLNGSLTKYICIAERRRIARLRGDSVENLLKLEPRGFKNISNNVDAGVFPSFESSTQPDAAFQSIMPNGVPDAQWVAMMYQTREVSMMALNNEVPQVEIAGQLDSKSNRLPSASTILEERTKETWTQIASIANESHIPRPDSTISKDHFTSLQHTIKVSHQAMQALRAPNTIPSNAEDAPTLFHENMLMSCYAHLELLRAVHKLADLVREKITKSKGKTEHPLKKFVPEKYAEELLDGVQKCYQAVRDVAQSYIDILGKSGAKAIRAQVRWGPTGAALRCFLGDEDVEFYAREYVDSAVEAWKGVLKVKLK